MKLQQEKGFRKSWSQNFILTSAQQSHLWTEVINILKEFLISSWPMIQKWSKYNDAFASFSMFLCSEKINPVLLNKNHNKNAHLNSYSQLWCRPHLQENSKTSRENFHLFVIMWSPKSLPPFLFILYPSLMHHLPNMLWNCALFRENKSKFLYAVEIFRLFYSLCDSRNTGERTQKGKHGQKSLKTTVFLTRQFSLVWQLYISQSQDRKR